MRSRLHLNRRTALPPSRRGREDCPRASFAFLSLRDLGVWMKPAARTIIDGKLHVDPGRFLEFTNGIYDTDDPEVIDVLRNRKGDSVGIGVDYFEDPFAQPHAGPEVREGPRTSDRSARAKPSELAARV
jgi:hypothetical protein